MLTQYMHTLRKRIVKYCLSEAAGERQSAIDTHICYPERYHIMIHIARLSCACAERRRKAAVTHTAVQVTEKLMLLSRHGCQRKSLTSAAANITKVKAPSHAYHVTVVMRAAIDGSIPKRLRKGQRKGKWILTAVCSEKAEFANQLLSTHRQPNAVLGRYRSAALQWLAEVICLCTNNAVGRAITRL